MLFILDRLIVFTISVSIAFTVIYPFRRFMKKHYRIEIFLLLFVCNVLFLFSPEVLFQGAAEGKDNLSFDEHRHVDSFSYGDVFFSISDYEFRMGEDDHLFTNSQVVMYEPWLVGYYESDQEGENLTYVYDDGAGTREIITFLYFDLEDGSRLGVIVNNLSDPLDSLVIAGATMSYTAIGTSKYLYFILPPESTFHPYFGSILYNGVQIGELFDE